MKNISRESFTAHNTGKEMPTGNAIYNTVKKLGFHDERVLLQGIAEDIHGLGKHSAKLSQKDLDRKDVHIVTFNEICNAELHQCQK